MSIFLAELRRIATDLDELGVNWCLIGGLACSAHAEPRTTKDIDVAVALSSPGQLEELVDLLLARQYSDPQVLMHVAPVYRMGFRVMVPTSRPYALPLDLLTSACGIEREIISAAERIELLPSLWLPIASRGHLLAMKTLSQDDHTRLRDKTDAVSLLQEATETDLETARGALRLIEERGFSRQKDLLSLLGALLDMRSNS